MKIDWFTFAAQIINFLILLALLKRFLYGPILKAIAEREAEIVSQFDAAEREQAAAEATRQDLQKQLDDLATTRQQLLAEAAEEVDRWKRERLGEAHADVDAARSDWFATLDREREQLRSRLLTQYRQHALQMARGVLTCLADVDSQKLLVDSFVRQLKGQLSMLPAVDGVTVWSAFDLAADQQQQVGAALADAGIDRADIDFRIDDSLICGIKVRTRSHEISWNAADSLTFLEGQFSRDLDETLSASEVRTQGSLSTAASSTAETGEPHDAS
jgi:F-type H+-transporting ATPase subunit b